MDKTLQQQIDEALQDVRAFEKRHEYPVRMAEIHLQNDIHAVRRDWRESRSLVSGHTNWQWAKMRMFDLPARRRIDEQAQYISDHLHDDIEAARETIKHKLEKLQTPSEYLLVVMGGTWRHPWHKWEVVSDTRAKAEKLARKRLRELNEDAPYEPKARYVCVIDIPERYLIYEKSRTAYSVDERNKTINTSIVAWQASTAQAQETVTER